MLTRNSKIFYWSWQPFGLKIHLTNKVKEMFKEALRFYNYLFCLLEVTYFLDRAVNILPFSEARYFLIMNQTAVMSKAGCVKKSRI